MKTNLVGFWSCLVLGMERERGRKNKNIFILSHFISFTLIIFGHIKAYFNKIKIIFFSYIKYNFFFSIYIKTSFIILSFILIPMDFISANQSLLDPTKFIFINNHRNSLQSTQTRLLHTGVRTWVSVHDHLYPSQFFRANSQRERTNMLE